MMDDSSKTATALVRDPVRRFIHDLNNHLGTAIGFTSFLAEDLPDQSAEQGYALRVQEALMACRDLIGGFAARQASIRRGAGSSNRPRLLLVASDGMIGDALAVAVEASGVEVAPCRSVEEAVEILREMPRWDAVMASAADADILAHLFDHHPDPIRLLYGGVDEHRADISFSAGRPATEVARLVAALLLHAG